MFSSPVDPWPSLPTTRCPWGVTFKGSAQHDGRPPEWWRWTRSSVHPSLTKGHSPCCSSRMTRCFNEEVKTSLNLCFGIVFFKGEARVCWLFFLSQRCTCAGCLVLGCLLWVARPQPMSQRAAAARGAAAPLPPPTPPPLPRPLCPDTRTPSLMRPAMPGPQHLPLRPCRLRLQERRRLLHPRRPRPPTAGRSVEFAASSGSPYQRRRCAGSPTSGRWRCGSSSTRLTSAPWRSSSGSRRRLRRARERQRRTRRPRIASPGPVPSRRAPRRRWAAVMTTPDSHQASKCLSSPMSTIYRQ